MRKESTESRSESRPEWEQLEDWVRSQVQRLIQELLEEEVTAFLGRAKSALRSDSDNDTGYRNGYGRARRLTLSSGTIQLRRPRVRDTEEQFESRLLPLFVNRTRKVAELIPELYLHGLSEGDFDLALRGLLGEDAPVSASTVARLKSKWNDELAQWRSRPLDDLEVVYMWVDGVYVKAGLEKEKAAVLVVMAALSDGSKVVVSAVPGYRESTESWSDVLRDMRRRGLECPRLVVGDGHLGIWGALRNVYPQAAEQRCWNHKIVNVLAKLPKRQQDQAKLMLRTIPYAPTRTEAHVATVITGRLAARYLHAVGDIGVDSGGGTGRGGHGLRSVDAVVQERSTSGAIPEGGLVGLVAGAACVLSVNAKADCRAGLGPVGAVSYVGDGIGATGARHRDGSPHPRWPSSRCPRW